MKTIMALVAVAATAGCGGRVHIDPPAGEEGFPQTGVYSSDIEAIADSCAPPRPTEYDRDVILISDGESLVNIPLPEGGTANPRQDLPAAGAHVTEPCLAMDIAVIDATAQSLVVEISESWSDVKACDIDPSVISIPSGVCSSTRRIHFTWLHACGEDGSPGCG